jgi:hypothetical protein
MSVKSIKPSEILNFLDQTFTGFVLTNLITEESKPSSEEIKDVIKEIKNQINIGDLVDDSAYGNTKFITLDELMNFKRQSEKLNDNEKIKPPSIASSLKSKHRKLIEAPKGNTKGNEV